MPMIFPIVCLLAGYPYQCRSDNAIADSVSLLDYFNNIATFMIWTFFIRNGFVDIGVKHISFQAGNAFSFNNVLQFPVDQFNSLRPGCAFTFRWASFERTFKIV
jgi:hypothetical protein